MKRFAAAVLGPLLALAAPPGRALAEVPRSGSWHSAAPRPIAAASAPALVGPRSAATATGAAARPSTSASNGSARATVDAHGNDGDGDADAEVDIDEAPDEEAEGEAESPGTPFTKSADFIEAIDVIGNEKTTRPVIIQHLLVRVGDLIDETKIEESRLRLLNTGYFKTVEFSLKRGSHRGKVLLVVEVVERNTVLIDQLYVGFSPLVPVYGGLGVTESNFLGKGVTAGAGFVAGKDRYAAELKLFVPYLSGTPLQLSASAIVVHGAETIDPDNQYGAELFYKRAGGTLGLGFGVGPSQRVSVDYRLEAVQADRLPNLDAAILRRSPQIQFDESVLSTISLAFERDTRDDPFVPTQGGRLGLEVEVGTKLIASTYEFSKYTAELQQAFSPVRRQSLIFRIAGGLIQGQAPFFDQFFVGDYAYFAIGAHALPRAVQVNFSPSNDYDDLLLSGSAEYVVPIFEGSDWLYRAYVFGGAAVTVTAALDELQEDKNGRGLGAYFPLSVDAGMKFDTCIGNFTLSLAYVLNLALL